VGSTGGEYPSREYVLQAMPAVSAATYLFSQLNEAGGVKKVVRAGTVAVAIYWGRLPTVVVIDMMQLGVKMYEPTTGRGRYY
jgi:hypothetical protein